jgi:indolepyruvate ferredoxin oxidoreductase
VSLEGAAPKKKSVTLDIHLDEKIKALPMPNLSQAKHWDLLVVGVGGTGIVTISAIIAMAAHLQGKGVSVLDFTGFAQKGGAVLSYVRLANSPQQLHQVRIDKAQADAMIACDPVVATSEKAILTLKPCQSLLCLNDVNLPTADSVLSRDAQLQGKEREDYLSHLVGAKRFGCIQANQLAEDLLGDSVFANMLMLGYSWQRGLLPVSLSALYRAIVINGVAIDKNKQAFDIGRLQAIPTACTKQKPTTEKSQSLTAFIAFRYNLLAQYHSKNLAQKYKLLVEKVMDFEKQTPINNNILSRRVAQYYFQVLYIKDEYEVARLYAKTPFLNNLKDQFEGSYTTYLHLAPPLLAFKKDAKGRPKKIKLKAKTLMPFFHLLCIIKKIRGSVIDPFSYLSERKAEKRVCRLYEERLSQSIKSGNLESALLISSLPSEVRGYGPVKMKALKTMESTLSKI